MKKQLPRAEDPLDPGYIADISTQHQFARLATVYGDKRDRLPHRTIRTGSIIGGTTLAALVVTGAVIISTNPSPERPSLGDVRTAAYQQPDVLYNTATCAAELAFEEQRVGQLVLRQAGAYAALYPTDAVYEKAIALATSYSVPCAKPATDVVAPAASFKLGNTEVTVTGSSNPVIPDAYPMVDGGTDVLDICSDTGTQPNEDMAAHQPAVKPAWEAVVDASLQYCPVTNPVVTGK